MRRRQASLIPLGAQLPEQKAEARIRQAWPFLVGHALTECTRPLRLYRGVLVIGCWDLTRIGALRDSIEAVWPQLRARIKRALKMELMGLQVQPCDPPPPVVPHQTDPDPLRRALTLLILRRQERQQLGRLPQDEPLDGLP